MLTKLFVYLLLACPSLLIAQTRLEATPQENNNCCYTFSYSLLPNDPAINILELRLPPAVAWQSYQVDLAGDWRIAPLAGENGFQLYLQPIGGESQDFPTQATDFFAVCFDLPSDRQAFDLEVRWKKNAAIRIQESITVDCGRCTPLISPEAVCLDSGGYLLEFQFINESIYPMDEIRLADAENSGLLPDSTLQLIQALNPGDTSQLISLLLGPEAESFDAFCLYLTGSRREGALRLDCCTALHCIDLPICDRCCTGLEMFQQDVAQGFEAEYVNISLDSACSRGLLQVAAIALNDCDEVLYTLSNLTDPGATLGIPEIGRDTATFGPGLLPATYEVCMRVNRQDLSGADCFESGELEVCDTLIVECQSVCGDPALFQEDVAAGFEVEYVNEDDLNRCFAASFIVTPNMLLPNDSVYYSVFFAGELVGDTSLMGLDPFHIMSLDSGQYQICMNVTRINELGESCFPTEVFCLDLINSDCVSTDYLRADDHWSIYPNPVYDRLFLEGDRPAEVLKIFDGIGRLIRTVELKPYSTAYFIEFGTLPAGIYLLILVDQQGQRYQSRIIRQ